MSSRAGAAGWAQVLYKIEYLLRCKMGDPRRRRDSEDGLPPMVSSSAKQLFIQGVTRDGRTFRPSDWAERLCGVMSAFRPGGPTPDSHLSYSPWCLPTVINGVKCVIVDGELRAYEPMAWDFVVNFAKDNDLEYGEACLLLEPPG